MSRSSTSDRGQTEPLAALVAVSAMAIALTVYGGYVNDVLPGTSDRTVEDATAERVWAMIETDGVFEPDDDADFEDRIDGTRLPQGFHVAVTVTRVDDDGRTVLVDDPAGGEVRGHFLTDGTAASSPTVDPPPDATAISRPISIRRKPGIVESGTLRVVVWE